MKPARAEIPVVLNCRAGSQAATEMTDRLAAAFAAVGLPYKLLIAGEGEDLTDLARQALLSRPPLIVAGGGDGTLNAVASLVVGTDTALGVLPLGTLNHFARDLHIPTELEDAVRTVAEGQVVRIDVGEVNGRIFLNNSSLGLYPSLVHHREQQQMRLGRSKWHALFWSALLMLRRYPMLNVSVTAGGDEMACRTPLVFVGNNEYLMEGLDVGIRERLDAGILSLYMPKHAGRLGLVRIALRALFKRLRRSDDFEMLRATELTIGTRRRRRVLVATDGEVAPTITPLHYRIRPGVLAVVVPAPHATDAEDH